jgi:UrcA family protein
LFAANPLAAAETHSIAIQSSDLNLAKDADRAILQQRIAHAVDSICGSAHARTTADIQAYATCSKATRAGAATQYDAAIAKAQMDMKVAGDRKSGMSAE